MKIIKVRLIVVIFISLTLSCNKDNVSDDVAVVEPRTQAEVTADFRALNLQPGINDFTLETLSPGVYWNFRVIAPEDASSSNKRPLVMDLHGGSGNSSPNAHKGSSCYTEEGLAELNPFIISPNAGAGEWYDIDNQNQVLILLQLATENWDIDSNKTVVTGFSNGGNGSWFFADFYPQFFSASIAVASSYDPERQDGSVPKMNIPLYVIHSDSDEVFPLAETQGFVNKEVNAGSDVVFVVAEGLSHFSPCDYVSYIQDAASWILNDVW